MDHGSGPEDRQGQPRLVGGHRRGRCAVPHGLRDECGEGDQADPHPFRPGRRLREGYRPVDVAWRTGSRSDRREGQAVGRGAGAAHRGRRPEPQLGCEEPGDVRGGVRQADGGREDRRGRRDTGHRESDAAAVTRRPGTPCPNHRGAVREATGRVVPGGGEAHQAVLRCRRPSRRPPRRPVGERQVGKPRQAGFRVLRQPRQAGFRVLRQGRPVHPGYRLRVDHRHGHTVRPDRH